LEIARNIREEFKNLQENFKCGEKYEILAKKYNLAADSVRKIINNRLWPE
jgi:Mor family transcriptional regulator